MRKLSLTVFTGAAAFVLLANFGARTASSRPQYAKEFAEHYHAKADSDKAEEKALGEAVAKAKCQVCHEEGNNRKNRNAYGKELAKVFSPPNEKDNGKIDAAFEKVSEMHIDANDPKSPTYGELIKHGKLPASEAKSGDGEKKAAP
jgi:mono/diheme cytochrome c family protein